MSRGCGTRVPAGALELMCRVDDPGGDSEPALVVRSGRRRTSTSDGTHLRFVEVVGFLDTYTAGRIDSTFADIADIADGQAIMLDVGGVSFLDSAGMRLLEQFRDRATSGGGRVWLHDPSRHVRRLIDILRLDRFDVYDPFSDRRHPDEMATVSGEYTGNHESKPPVAARHDLNRVGTGLS